MIETKQTVNGRTSYRPAMSGELEVVHRFSPETILGATVVTVATLGAFSRYLNQYLKSGKFFWREMIANYVVSMFAAFMFALFIYSFWPGVRPTVVILAAGTGSYFGDKAMITIFDFIKTQMKIQQKEEAVTQAKPKTRAKKVTIDTENHE